MSFLDKLHNFFKSASQDSSVREIAAFYPPAAVALKVSDLVNKSRAGDKDATARLSAIKTLAATGDPKAQEAITMAKGINDAANAKKKSGSMYDLGVSVGHDPMTFVGAIKSGYSWNYTSGSWYRTPKGQPDIPGPDGPGNVTVNQHGKGGSNVTITPGGATRTATLNPAQLAAMHAKGRGQMGSEQLRAHGSMAQMSFAAKQAFAKASAARQADKKSVVRDLSPVLSDPNAFQDHNLTAWDLGLPTTVPLQYQQEWGVDAQGNPLNAEPDYGNPFGAYGQYDPSTPSNFNPYGGFPGYGGMGAYSSPWDFGGLPQGYDGGYGFGYDEYGGIPTSPANRVYDPNTDSFYSGCQTQVYDPDTNSFSLKVNDNPYAQAWQDFGGVAGWTLNIPYRSTSQHVTQAAKSPGIALAARELYNRGIGQPPTTRNTVVKQGLSGRPILSAAYDLASRYA